MVKKNVACSDVRIRSNDEARAAIRESFQIDRGFLSKRATLAILLAAVVLFFVARLWSLAPLGLLVFDFIWFVVRRRRVLQGYEAGRPRLETGTDFEAVAEAFSRSGTPEPTMTDWHEAAGFGDVPKWREDLRYRSAAALYRGGVLLDVGCGDGRLCWQYRVCVPEKYIGVDIAPGLLETLTEETNGRARAVLAVAEDLRLPDASVDIVICSEAFEHIPNPQVALVEFNRVLKPRGRIVIQSPNALRLRNINPIHILSLVAGYWMPSVLLRKVVHANSFVHAFTYHWDFTRQDIARYARACPGLTVRSIKGATYRFNPEGTLLHRLLAGLFRSPIVHWLGWDLTVVLEKQF